MDALSDPRAFMSGQNKRDDQMKSLGIEESDASKAAQTGANKNPKGTEVAAEDKRGEPRKFLKYTKSNI